MTITGRLARRLARSAPAVWGRQARRRLATLLSAAARSEARATSLPRGYRWMKLGSVGAIHGPAAGYVRRDLLTHPLADGDSPLDAVLVTTAVLDTPDRLDETVADALIECEKRSVPTVFVARSDADLTGPLPGLCRVTLTEHGDLVPAFTARLGSQRTVLVRTGVDWLSALTRISRAG